MTLYLGSAMESQDAKTASGLKRFEVWFTLLGAVVAIREVEAASKMGAVSLATAGLKGKGVLTEKLTVYSCVEVVGK